MRAGPRTKPLLSVSEAAALAGVSRSVAYQWVRAGCMPGHVELNGRHYVKRAVLLAWLADDGDGASIPTPGELATARDTRAAVGRTAAREGA